jgi:hypothetical protein
VVFKQNVTTHVMNILFFCKIVKKMDLKKEKKEGGKEDLKKGN